MTARKPPKKTKTSASLTHDADMLDEALNLAPTDEIADAAEDLHDDLLICYGIVQSVSEDATIEDALKLLPEYRDAIQDMDRDDEGAEREVVETRGEPADPIDEEFREPGDAPARRSRRSRRGRS